MFDNMLNSDSEPERKGTFVGTVNYLAPEMIKESEATLATDLWRMYSV